jgi:CRP-like cAMP-binding protein
MLRADMPARGLTAGERLTVADTRARVVSERELRGRPLSVLPGCGQRVAKCTILCCPPQKDKDVRNTMIDRIRQDIQERLEQLLAEADRLRQALTALGGERSAPATRSTSARPSSSSRARTRSTRSTRSAGTASRPRATSAPASRTRGASAARTRGSAGGTKSSVLKALADANGGAMTASEVASATGLGRASVSTTLSKLAKSGEVSKANRGYQLSTGGTSASTATPTS